MRDVEEEEDEEEEGLEEDTDLLVRLPGRWPRALRSSLWKRPGACPSVCSDVEWLPCPSWACLPACTVLD